MDFQPTDTRLPVRQIRDANLSWVRSDPGPYDDGLMRSLRKEGMRFPILLTTEFVIADGARRFLRAERLGWQEVPVVVTTDWEVVRQYFETARKLEADGNAHHEPMSWTEIVDLVAGPMDLLYHRRRLERGRASRAAAAARKAAGLPKISTKNEIDYVGEVADVLGWRRSDLRSVREIFWALTVIEAQEAAERAAAVKEGGAEAAERIPQQALLLRGEVIRLEEAGGVEGGGLYSMLKKLRWIVSGKDPIVLKTGRAKRRVGEPTFTERKARRAADPNAVGRELDAPTVARVSQMLTVLGTEADEYTHVRPSVRIEEAKAAARDLKAAVNQINRLIRLIKSHAEYLEESK